MIGVNWGYVTAMTFDSLAADYDADFSERPTARVLRGLTHERLQKHVWRGAYVLEIGCGTGIDAAVMADLGARVDATDASSGMLAITRDRLAGQPMVDVRLLDINALPADVDVFRGPYDVVWANFGALNACQDLGSLAHWLSARMAVGGVICMAVMSRFCLWETLWLMLHGDVRRAMRRWGGQTEFLPPQGRAMTVFYPSMRQLERAFAPWFKVQARRGLGVALPPSEMFDVVEQRAHLAALLTGCERRLWLRGWGARVADHVWWEMVRQA